MKKNYAIFEQAMVMLKDVPGETMLERIAKLKDWYLEMQTLFFQLDAENKKLKAKIEELDKRDYIISSNRNSFM